MLKIESFFKGLFRRICDQFHHLKKVSDLSVHRRNSFVLILQNFLTNTRVYFSTFIASLYRFRKFCVLQHVGTH